METLLLRSFFAGTAIACLQSYKNNASAMRLFHLSYESAAESENGCTLIIP
jgi:hypothetical protein